MKLTQIKALIDEKLKNEDWKDFEIETIIHELNLPVDTLLIDQIGLLKMLANDNQAMMSDPVFFLHGCEICNDFHTDFTMVPMPTILEVGWAVVFLTKYFGKQEPTNAIKKTITFLLKEEGYSVPPSILTSYCFPDELHPGQLKEDIDAKEKAMFEYIKEMIK